MKPARRADTRNAVKTPVNLVNQHRTMAQNLLEQLVKIGSIPKNFSGLMTPKFGNMIFIWQFVNMKLVGANVIHINNVDGIAKKLKEAKGSLDWASLKGEVEDVGNGTDGASAD